MEMIGLEELEINFEQPLNEALKENGFIEFRVLPSFRDPSKYQPQFFGIEKALAHFFKVPAGYDILQLPEVMEERMFRGPKDIREIIAVGKTLTGDHHELSIFAPDITGSPNKLVKITRHPGWTGLGLIVNSFDPDHDILWRMDFVAFSNT